MLAWRVGTVVAFLAVNTPVAGRALAHEIVEGQELTFRPIDTGVVVADRRLPLLAQ